MSQIQPNCYPVNPTIFPVPFYFYRVQWILRPRIHCVCFKSTITCPTFPVKFICLSDSTEFRICNKVFIYHIKCMWTSESHEIKKKHIKALGVGHIWVQILVWYYVATFFASTKLRYRIQFRIPVKVTVHYHLTQQPHKVSNWHYTVANIQLPR